MKKKFFLLLTALAYTLLAQADNLIVKDLTIPQGGTATVAVELNNPDHEFTAFQMSLQVPEGITAITTIKNEKVVVVTTDGTRFDDHQLSSSAYTGGYGFAAFSANTFAISGQSGVLFSFDVQADAALQVGTQLTAKFTGIAFTTTGHTVEVTLDDAPFVITIGEPDDGRIHFDETSTKLPTYTAGEKGDVTLKRTIKAGQWSTIVMPFNLTKANATAIFGSDVEFAKFNGFEVDYGDDDENVIPLGITINFTSYSIPARGNLAGGTPVLIKTSKDISEIKLDQVTLAGSVLNEEKADEYGTPGKFIGTLTKTVVPEDGLFISDNKFWYSTGATNIKAFRGWFELGAVLDKETDFSVKMFIDDFETKVDGIGIRDAAGTIYDLGGRKITKPQQRGVYIVNGQKVIVK